MMLMHTCPRRPTSDRFGTPTSLRLPTHILLSFPSLPPSRAQGNVETAFTKADNSNIVATDTVKNTVYIVARRNQFASIEEFGVILGK